MNMSALKYVMSQIIWKFYSTETKKCTYLALTENSWLNNKTVNVSDEVWMWVHQKYGMSQITKKLYSTETNKCTYLDVPGDDWLNWRNSDREWWSMNVSELKLWNESNHTKFIFSKNELMLLPHCYWWGWIESAK